ncbi:MAG: glycosyltransferase family 87 protein [Pseudomonadota bacterium]
MSIRSGLQALDGRSFLIAGLLVSLLVLVVFVAISTPYIGASDMFTDFDAFYVASMFFWEGRIADAYDLDVMLARQHELAGRPILMPWSYPPQFNLITAPMALAPRGVSYAIFIVLTLALYLVAMRALVGRLLVEPLVVVFPALAMTVSSGQNAFLTAALIGAFCLLSLKGKNTAGLPLGLMVIKPHLAVGLGLSVLFRKRWMDFAVVSAVIVASSLVATLVLGPEIWSAVIQGAVNAAANTGGGEYKLFRMSSAFATLRSFGIDPGVAFSVHAIVAAALVASIALAVHKGWPLRRVLCVSVFATLAISPYSYDYDMTALAVCLILVAQDLARHARPYERLVIILSGWLCTGWGWMTYLFLYEDAAPKMDNLPALGGIGFLALAVVILRVLHRAWREEQGMPQSSYITADPRRDASVGAY